MERYELGREVGSGGFARVVAASFRLTKHEVAIKIIPTESEDPDHLRDIHREITLMEEIDHPFVCRIFDHIKSDSHIYVVMERLGESLLAYLNRVGPIPEVYARVYICQVISGLSELHKRGICHRDVTLENLLFDKNGNLRLIDFGLATRFEKTFPLMKTICGSPGYVAPEQLRGERYTPSVDVWGCGVVLFAIISGQLPFAGENVRSVAEAVLTQEPQWPAGISGELRDLLERMLCKDWLKRIPLDEVLTHPWMAMGNVSAISEIPDVVERAFRQVEKLRFTREQIEAAVKGEEQSDAKIAFRIMKRALETDEIEKVCGPALHRSGIVSEHRRVKSNPNVLYRAENKSRLCQLQKAFAAAAGNK